MALGDEACSFGSTGNEGGQNHVAQAYHRSLGRGVFAAMASEASAYRGFGGGRGWGGRGGFAGGWNRGGWGRGWGNGWGWGGVGLGLGALAYGASTYPYYSDYG